MDLAEAIATIELQQGQIMALYTQLEARDATIEALQVELVLKQFEIDRLRRALFGQSRERHLAQGPWLPGMEPQTAPQTPAPEPKPCRAKGDDAPTRKKPRPRLETDASRVPERHEIIAPEVKDCAHCGSALVEIGEETSTRVEITPSVLQRITTHRLKMACQCCKEAGVIVAPKDDPPITGSGPVGLSLAVDIATQHYADHMPFHRIAERYGRDGLRIDRGFLSRVAARVSDALRPVVESMEQQLLGADVVMGIDGTGIKIFQRHRCKRHAAYVLHGLGHVVYRMLEAEDASTILKGFEDFRGVVVCDAAKVHTGQISVGLGLKIALCNAHARRKFFEAKLADPTRAHYALDFYSTVARWERQWHDLDPEARLAQRQKVLVPLFEDFRRWLVKAYVEVMPRSPVAGALGYALGHHGGLTLFLGDGRVPWTNNESERHLRHIVVGRKAWVFRGSYEGAERGCVLWSLTMSCRLHGIDPRQYLLDTLTALSHTPHGLVWTLTPKEYAARQQTTSAAAA